MKKTFALIALIIAFLFGSVPVLAVDLQPAQALRVAQAAPTPQPYCGDHQTEATPGRPVNLRGTGIACATGRGKLAYAVRRGTVRIGGYGLVAVKGGSVAASGWDHKFEFGDWIVYLGEGQLTVSGQDYRVVSYMRKAQTKARGTGSATYQGEWQIRYGRLFRIQSESLEPIDLPAEILDRVPADAFELAR